jgi:hypothetical protein
MAVLCALIVVGLALVVFSGSNRFGAGVSGPRRSRR